MSNLLLMCLEFFKTGLFAIGGGLATIPFLTDIAKNHPEWFTVDELTNMIAVAESTPGPIGINVSTYAGFQSFGLPGAILATLSLVAPSFIIILIVFKIWQKYKENKKVQNALLGLRPAGVGLILSSCFTVFLGAVLPTGSFDWILFLLFLLFFAVMQIPKFKKVHPIVYILIAGVLGIVLGL